MRLIGMSTDVTPPKPPPALNTSALPDDPAVLKQMIAELIRALRSERRDKEALQGRLDALLRRLYGPRPGPIDPNQPLLFAQPPAEEVPQPPPPPPSEDQPKQRGQTNKPHGRRRPAAAGARAAPRRAALRADGGRAALPRLRPRAPGDRRRDQQTIRLQAGRGLRHRASARQVRLQVL